MSPFTYKVSVSAFIRRLWTDKWVQPLVMGMMVLVITTHMSNGLTQVTPESKATANQHLASHQNPVITRLSPHLQQARAKVNHRWMTEASMTNHSLTAAQFLGRRADKELSAETKKLTEQG